MPANSSDTDPINVNNNSKSNEFLPTDISQWIRDKNVETSDSEHECIYLSSSDEEGKITHKSFEHTKKTQFKRLQINSDDSSGDEACENTKKYTTDTDSDNMNLKDKYAREKLKETMYAKKSKWCVCDQGDSTTVYSKMCEKCNQWYHLNCLGYSKKTVDDLLKGRNSEEFICPVCVKDLTFVKKYEKKIEFRTNKYSTVILSDQSTTDFATSSEDFDSDIENHVPKSRTNTKSVTNLKHTPKPCNVSKVTSSIKIIRKTPETKNSDKVTGRPLPAVAFTAKSSDLPIELRKNLQCVQCKAYLKEKYHPVPKKIQKTYSKENKNLLQTWFDSVYCDDVCITSYLEEELKKPEHLTSKTIDLLDSITKRRQKHFFTENSTSSELQKKIFAFLVVNPKFFIMDSKYKTDFGPKEKSLTKPSSSLSITKPVKKPVTQTKTYSILSLDKQTKSVSPTAVPVAKVQVQSVKPTQTKLDGLPPERSNMKKQVAFNLTIRYEKTDKKLLTTPGKLDIEKLAENIEFSCYDFFNDSKKYKARMISIILNIKCVKNNSFYLKILNGKFTPEQLPRIDVEEMADDRLNDERLKQRIEDLKNTKKFSDEINKEKSKPHIKKTSKGEEYVGDGVFSTTPPRFDETSNDTNDIIPEPTISLETIEPIKSNESLAQLTDARLPVEIPVSISSLSPSNASNTVNVENILPQRIDKIHMPIKLDSVNTDFVNLLNENLSKPVPPPIPIHTTNMISDVPPLFSPVSVPTIPLFNSDPLKFEFKTDKPSALAMTKSYSKFWSGQMEAHDNNVMGACADMIPNRNKTLADKIINISFPDKLEIKTQHGIKPFWGYLEHIQENCDAKLVFFKLNSREEHTSKMYLQAKHDYMPIDDTVMTNIVFNFLIMNEKVLEFKVPNSLQTHVGFIYIAPLKSKNFSECPGLKKKFGISMPRIMDQFIGILIDVESKKNHKLISDFATYQSNHETKKIETSKRKSSEAVENPHSQIKIFEPISKSSISVTSHSDKRKSSEILNPEEVKRTRLTPSNEKTKFSKYSALRDPRLGTKTNESTEKNLEEIQHVTTVEASSPRDTRIIEVNTPMNTRIFEFNQATEPVTEIPPADHATMAADIEDEIKSFPVKLKQKLITKEEATSWVAKTVESKQLTVAQQFIILDSLQSFLNELKQSESEPVPVISTNRDQSSPTSINEDISPCDSIPKTSTTEDLSSCDPITKTSTKKKRKKKSRFSEIGEPAKDSLYSDGISKSDSALLIKSTIKSNNTPAYYSIDRLFVKLALNGYDISFRSYTKTMLTKVLDENNTPDTQLTKEEVIEFKRKYAHLFPELILIIECRNGVQLDLNNNNNNLNKSNDNEKSKKNNLVLPQIASFKSENEIN